MFYLKLLGNPTLHRDDGTPITGRLTQRHRIALLAMLALAREQRLSRDKLIGYLWPESDEERGRNLLRVSTYVIRSAIGEDAMLTEGEDLRLNLATIEVDAVEFDDAFDRADYARAVDLYKGPLLDGFFISDAPEFMHWLDDERSRLAGHYRKALESLAERAEAAQDWVDAVEWWKLRASQDLLDSRVALRLMQAMAASGNQAGALQHAAIHERLLQEELGMRAPPEIDAYVEQLRREPIKHKRVEPVERATVATTSEVFSAGEINARRRTWRRTAAVFAVVLLVGALWALWPRHSAPDNSIVVLPFLNISRNADDEYFSDGLTEEIIARLSAIGDLKVISRTSAMYYKGSKKPLRQIADELDIAHVLEGSVRRDGGRLRVTAKLVDARADKQLWADNYDYALADILRVQDVIATKVVDVLELELSEPDSVQLVRRGTRDPEAYELYRRGRFLWNTRTREAHQQAIHYYRLAIHRDSAYADAYGGIADAYLTMYQLNYGISEADAYARVKWAAERAIALDERSADAHVAFAIALWWQRNWPGAERELRRAIELNRNHATAHAWYVLLLTGMGRLDEADRLSRRAAELDPFAPVPLGNRARACYLLRNFDCAVEYYGKAVEVSPTFATSYLGLGISYSALHQHDPAIRAMQQAAALRSDFLADLAYTLARAGRRQEARQTLQRAKQKPAFEPFYVARVHAALGEADSAFAWLERSSWHWPHRAVRFDPALDPIRGDPRFAQLSARIDREMGMRP